MESMKQGTLYSAISSLIVEVGGDTYTDCMARKIKYLCDYQSDIAEVLDVATLYTDEWNIHDVWDAYQYIENAT